MICTIGYRQTSLIGGIALIIGTVFFTLLPIIQNYIWAGIASFFIGIGMGMTSTAFIVAIQTTVDWQVRGIATATNMFMRSMGSALGVAFFGGLLNKAIKRQIEQSDVTQTLTVDAVDMLLDATQLATLSKEVVDVLQTGLIQGMQHIYFWLAALAILSYILILRMPKEDE